MRDAFAERLRCPRCRAEGSLALTASERDVREVRDGVLTCSACGHEARVHDGIADLLHDPPAFVVREAEGLGRFAQRMRDDGWTREDVTALPDRHDGYWYAQEMMFDQVVETVPFAPGDRLLDLGANTCWASAGFAQRGLDVTALDIADHEMQGLRTADWQFEAKDVFFERVLGVMFDLPFAAASFDYVWASEVLHHNHRPDLLRTMRECHRVLRPGGKLIVCNEPLRTLRTPKLRPGHEVAEFEGNEHAYMRFNYVRPARAAGFDVDVRGPFYNGLFNPKEIGLSDRMNDRQIIWAAAGALARRRPWLMRASLASRSYLRGGTGLHMVCTKAPPPPRAPSG